MNRTTLNVTRRLAGVAVLTLALVGVGAMSASAHAELVSSNPADGSTLGVAPTQVVLTFNEAVATVGNQIVVTSPSGLLVNQGSPTVNGATVSVPLRSLAENGTYLINYRIVSDDGHPVQRQLSFTLNVPGLKDTASSSPSPITSTAPSGSSGPNVWVIVIGAAVVGIVIGLAATLLGRRKGTSESTQGADPDNPHDLVD